LKLFDKKKKPKQKDQGPVAFLSSKWHLHNCVKTHQPICVDIQICQLLKGGIDQWGVSRNSFFLWLEPHQRHQIFELCNIREVNPLVLGSNDNVN
jgi:hypothetical protein